ncbi:unnamed protein product [Notodromas monacha]|uniref:BRCT domain-containing protein n=1 Tax=Notodromas monacha TaxID=399045 RepID=A0A7R9BQ08_9CRUS|nr:unnamed protein product [Notodromas monacha]CAG0919323.1 unnamed protein product [Notodromas monacha]
MEFADVGLMFLPDKIQKKRLDVLKSCARKNGFNVLEKPARCLTHVVTEMDSLSLVEKHLKHKFKPSEVQRALACSVQIVDMDWFHKCVREKRLINESAHRIPDDRATEDVPSATVEKSEFDLDYFNANPCERIAPLDGTNEHLAVKLVELSLYWQLVGNVFGDQAKSLAFRKAASALRCLPFAVTHPKQVNAYSNWYRAELRNVKDIGEHATKILTDLLLRGSSEELEQKLASEEFLTVQKFSAVFGIGAVNARKIYSRGCSSITDLIDRVSDFGFSNDNRVKHGLAFYEDLSTPTTRPAADAVREFSLKILKEVEITLRPSMVESGIVLELVGGFRRGKPSGHDVDFLLGHKQGLESELLRPFIERLKTMGLMLFGRIEGSEFTSRDRGSNFQSSGATMDGYEKCLGILKVPKDGYSWDDLRNEAPTGGKGDLKSLIAMSDNRDRRWTAMRVDYVVVSQVEWWYGVLGWTGNTQLSRMLRIHCKKQLNLSLNNHGLWNPQDNSSAFDENFLGPYLIALQGESKRWNAHDAEVLRTWNELLSMVTEYSSVPFNKGTANSISTFPLFWGHFLPAVLPCFKAVSSKANCDDPVLPVKVYDSLISLISAFIDKLECSSFEPKDFSADHCQTVTQVVNGLLELPILLKNEVRLTGFLWRTFGRKVLPLIKKRCPEVKAADLACAVSHLCASISQYLGDCETALKSGSEAADARLARNFKLIALFLKVLVNLLEDNSDGFLKLRIEDVDALVSVSNTVIGCQLLSQFSERNNAEINERLVNHGVPDAVRDILSHAVKYERVSEYLRNIINGGDCGTLQESVFPDLAKYSETWFIVMCLDLLLSNESHCLEDRTSKGSFFSGLFHLALNGLTALPSDDLPLLKSHLQLLFVRFCMSSGSKNYEQNYFPLLWKSMMNGSSSEAVFAASVLSGVSCLPGNSRLVVQTVRVVLNSLHTVCGTNGNLFVCRWLLEDLIQCLEIDDVVVVFDDLREGSVSVDLLAFVACAGCHLPWTLLESVVDDVFKSATSFRDSHFPWAVLSLAVISRLSSEHEIGAHFAGKIRKLVFCLLKLMRDECLWSSPFDLDAVCSLIASASHFLSNEALLVAFANLGVTLQGRSNESSGYPSWLIASLTAGTLLSIDQVRFKDLMSVPVVEEVVIHGLLNACSAGLWTGWLLCSKLDDFPRILLSCQLDDDASRRIAILKSGASGYDTWIMFAERSKVLALANQNQSRNIVTSSVNSSNQESRQEMLEAASNLMKNVEKAVDELSALSAEGKMLAALELDMFSRIARLEEKLGVLRSCS